MQPSMQSEPKRVPGRPFAKGHTVGFKKLSHAGRKLIEAAAAKLFDEMAPDFGPLSATDKVLLMQACFLIVRSRRTSDADMAARISGTALRLVAEVRGQRRVHSTKAKPSDSGSDDLDAYLRSRPRDPRKQPEDDGGGE
jgi:hypothetical protein